LLSELEKVKKRYQTYVVRTHYRLDPRNEHEDSVDERIRGNYNITRTVTGRGSCDSPNLQQIPRADTLEKKAIKDIFTCDEGTALIQVDHKTSEVKWLAMMSGDPGLLRNFKTARKHVDAFRKDPDREDLLQAMQAYDFHKLTASLMFNTPVEKIVKKQRQAAKAITFGLIYGKTAASLSVDLKVSKQEAEELVALFFKHYPLAKQWLLDMERKAERNGYVENPIGRRRRLADAFLSGDDYTIQHAKNQSRNSPIQAISSDCAILGGALFQDYITENRIKTWKTVAFVHDSIVWQAPYDDIAESIGVAEELMTTCTSQYVEKHFGYKMVLPLDLEFEIGHRLGTLQTWNFSPRHLTEIIDSLRDVA